MMFYKLLDDHTVVACDDVREWGLWMVDQEDVPSVGYDVIGEIIVSTVFLGMDANCMPGGTPSLFETALFVKGPTTGVQVVGRCATWAEAESLHRAIVAQVSRAKSELIQTLAQATAKEGE